MQREPMTLLKSTGVAFLMALIAEISIVATSQFTEMFGDVSGFAKVLLFAIVPFAGIGLYWVCVLLGVTVKMSTTRLESHHYETDQGFAFDVIVHSGMIPATYLKLTIGDIKAYPIDANDQHFLERQRRANGLKNCALTVYEDARTRTERETFSLGVRQRGTVRLAHWRNDKALWILISEGQFDEQRIKRPKKACLIPGKYRITVCLNNHLFALTSATFDLNVTQGKVPVMERVTSSG